MSQTQQPFSAAGRLRQLLSDSNHTVVAPGVYDGISARLALAQGFECLYMVRQHCGDWPISNPDTPTNSQFTKTSTDWRRHRNVTSRHG